MVAYEYWKVQKDNHLVHFDSLINFVLMYFTLRKYILAIMKLCFVILNAGILQSHMRLNIVALSKVEV